MESKTLRIGDEHENYSDRIGRSGNHSLPRSPPSFSRTPKPRQALCSVWTHHQLTSRFATVSRLDQLTLENRSDHGGRKRFPGCIGCCGSSFGRLCVHRQQAAFKLVELSGRNDPPRWIETGFIEPWANRPVGCALGGDHESFRGAKPSNTSLLAKGRFRPTTGINKYGVDHYYVAFLGNPSTSEPWMFQFGGHHPWHQRNDLWGRCYFLAHAYRRSAAVH